ncbi:MAG: hypothetical protein KAH07_00190, partial [Flavobacteriaceae bacterium]|nr:hypothetical protein [Flavobacteriaceae bacterium]
DRHRTDPRGGDQRYKRDEDDRSRDDRSRGRSKEQNKGNDRHRTDPRGGDQRYDKDGGDSRERNQGGNRNQKRNRNNKDDNPKRDFVPGGRDYNGEDWDEFDPPITKKVKGNDYSDNKYELVPTQNALGFASGGGGRTNAETPVEKL